MQLPGQPCAFRGSNKNAAWTTLADRTATARPGRYLVDVLPGTGQYRYVRVTMTGATNGHPASLSQLEVLVDD